MGENGGKTIENMLKPFSIVLVWMIRKHARKRIVLLNENTFGVNRKKPYENACVEKIIFLRFGTNENKDFCKRICVHGWKWGILNTLMAF